MELQAEKERVIQIIRDMPEDKFRDMIQIIDELDEDVGAPESVEVRNEAELKEFLREGIEAAKQNDVLPWRDVMAQLKAKYSL